MPSQSVPDQLRARISLRAARGRVNPQARHSYLARPTRRVWCPCDAEGATARPPVGAARSQPCPLAAGVLVGRGQRQPRHLRNHRRRRRRQRRRRGCRTGRCPPPHRHHRQPRSAAAGGCRGAPPLLVDTQDDPIPGRTRQRRQASMVHPHTPVPHTPDTFRPTSPRRLPGVLLTEPSPHPAGPRLRQGLPSQTTKAVGPTLSANGRRTALSARSALTGQTAWCR